MNPKVEANYREALTDLARKGISDSFKREGLLGDFRRYALRGDAVIRMHPDFGDSYVSCATDVIADILHALFDSDEARELEGIDTLRETGPRDILDRALRCYEGDQEDRLGYCAVCETYGVDIDARGADNLSVCDECRDEEAES